MTTIHTHTTLDAAALRRAYSARDAAALLALYADDATVEIVDAQNTPSTPLRLDGSDGDPRALRGRLRARHDPRGRHRRRSRGDAAGYSLRCAYPDGIASCCARQPRSCATA